MSTEIIVVPSLAEFPLIVALRESALAYASVHTAHLLGVALMVGCVVAFDLRILGVNRAIRVDHLAKHLLPLALCALVLIVPTGLAMFAVHSGDLLTSRLFILKMSLLMLSSALAIVFHTGPYRSVERWHTDVPAPKLARVVAALSIVVWLAVLLCASLLRA
jgi:hypothetical protein